MFCCLLVQYFASLVCYILPPCLPYLAPILLFLLFLDFFVALIANFWLSSASLFYRLFIYINIGLCSVRYFGLVLPNVLPSSWTLFCRPPVQYLFFLVQERHSVILLADVLKKTTHRPYRMLYQMTNEYNYYILVSAHRSDWIGSW